MSRTLPPSCLAPRPLTPASLLAPYASRQRSSQEPDTAELEGADKPPMLQESSSGLGEGSRARGISLAI